MEIMEATSDTRENTTERVKATNSPPQTLAKIFKIFLHYD